MSLILDWIGLGPHSLVLHHDPLFVRLIRPSRKSVSHITSACSHQPCNEQILFDQHHQIVFQVVTLFRGFDKYSPLGNVGLLATTIVLRQANKESSLTNTHPSTSRRPKLVSFSQSQNQGKLRHLLCSPILIMFAVE